MKVEIISQSSLITKNLLELINNLVKEQKHGYSDAIELELSELVKFDLRKIAQQGNNISNRESILEQALSITKREIQTKLKKYSISFDLDCYFKSIQNNLKFTAREISDLKNRLSQSKELKRIGERKRIDNQLNIPVEIIELGLHDHIEGLMAFPLVEECEIDLERIEMLYTVKGDFFPYELVEDEFTFVVDDDGTIFVSTENFPNKLIEEVREKLNMLAWQLYVGLT